MSICADPIQFVKPCCGASLPKDMVSIDIDKAKDDGWDVKIGDRVVILSKGIIPDYSKRHNSDLEDLYV